MNTKFTFQPANIPPPNQNNLFSNIKGVLLVAVVFVFLFIVWNALNNTVLNQYTELQNEYHKLFRDSERDRDITSHYRISSATVYYYETCRDPFKTWCTHELVGVAPREFEPLGKDLARVVTDDGVKIYFKQLEVTHLIAKPERLRALEQLATNPIFFTDESYIYNVLWFSIDYSSGEGIPNLIPSDSFPKQLQVGDTYDVPLRFQVPEDRAACQAKPLVTRVLFHNNNVYLNGSLVPEADAKSFEPIRYDSDPVSVVGPWFRDANNVYFIGYKIEGANPDSFKLHNKITSPWNSCYESYPLVGSDNDGVYYASFHPRSYDCKGGARFCPVDIMIPGVSSLGLNVDPAIGEYALQERYVLRNDRGEYYLDGQLKNDADPVVVLVSRNVKEVGKDIEVENDHRLYYEILTQHCAADSATKTLGPEEKFTLYVNGRQIGQLKSCDSYFDKVYLKEGDNLIEVRTNSGEIVYSRNYTL